jgi:hypothetical protein
MSQHMQRIADEVADNLSKGGPGGVGDADALVDLCRQALREFLSRPSVGPASWRSRRD